MTDSPLRHRVKNSIENKEQVLSEYQYRFNSNQSQCVQAHGINQGMLSRWIQQSEAICHLQKRVKSVE